MLICAVKMRKRSHKTAKVVVNRRIFRARSVLKCVCRRGSAPDPTGEAYIKLTASSVLPVPGADALALWLVEL